MNHVWQLQEAKSKFSQVIDLAIDEGPQIVTRHGAEIAVIISFRTFQNLTKPNTSLIEFFRQSPLVECEIDLTRIQTPLPAPLEL